MAYASAILSSATIRANAVNACGTSQPGIYNVNINLSCRTTSEVKAPKENGHITAFPNPTSSRTIISFESISNTTALFRLVNQQGNIILTEAINVIEGSNNKEIDLSSFSKGIYLLQINFNDLKSESLPLILN